MPIAVVIYNLPTEQDEFDMSLKAGAYRAAFGDVWNKVRSKLKYEETSAEEGDAFETMREWMRQACEEWEVEVP